MPDYVTWGSTSFRAKSVRIQSYPRALNVAYNAISPEPVITTSAVSGFGQVTISAQIVGTGETTQQRRDSLTGIYASLQALADAQQSALTVNGEAFRAFRSDQVSVNYDTDEWGAGVVSVEATINVLPASTLPDPDY